MDSDTEPSFIHNKRAVAPLIGFILLFAIGIVAFSTYQAFIIPSQNAEVEFNHNSDVQGDMQDLRNSVLDIRSVERIEQGEYEKVSEHRSVRVQLGTNYPNRLIALNPPRPTGALSTEQPGQSFVIEGVDVQDPDAFVVDETEIEDLFESFEEGEFETRFLSYQPRYNEYQNAPQTMFEHSLLYNSFGDTDLAVTNQRLIDGTRLNVVLFSGDVSRSSSQAVTLDPETLDGPTAPIRIEAENENIEFTIPTNTPELWKSDNVIGKDFNEGEPHAKVTSNETNEVTIELEEDETYQLRVARVGFDGGSVDDNFTRVQYEDPESAPIDIEFDQLDLTEVTTGGQWEFDIQYELSSQADVTFTAEENDGDTADPVTETETTGGTITLTFRGGGNNDFPVELEANISDGECLETTVQNDGDTKSLEDWNECTT